MSGLKNTVHRILFILGFITIFMVICQVVIYFMTMNKANTIMDDVVEKANTLLFSNNVISTDIVNSQSDMASFIDMLRSAETDSVKFDIDYSSTSLTNGSEDIVAVPSTVIGSPTPWNRINDDNSPIKMYTISKDGTRSFIDDYGNCPQRGSPVYCDITMNVYVPRLINFKVSTKMEGSSYSDNITALEGRYLEKITETASAIGIKFYKGK